MGTASAPWPASPRRSACRCPARRRSRPCIADRLVAAEETGKAAVRLIESRITPRAGHHREVGRERAPRADGARRLDQRHRASDRHRRAPRHQDLDRPPQRRSPTRRRCWSTSSRSARATWRTSTPPAAWARVLRELRAAAAPRHHRRRGRAPWPSGSTSRSTGWTARSSARSPTRSRRSAA